MADIDVTGDDTFTLATPATTDKNASFKTFRIRVRQETALLDLIEALVASINRAMYNGTADNSSLPRVIFNKTNETIRLHMASSVNRDPINIPRLPTETCMEFHEMVLNYISMQLNTFLSVPQAEVAYMIETNLKCLFSYVIKDDLLTALCSKIRETYNTECNYIFEKCEVKEFLTENWGITPDRLISSVMLILAINYLISRLRLLRSKLKEQSNSTKGSMTGRPMMNSSLWYEYLPPCILRNERLTLNLIHQIVQVVLELFLLIC